MAEDTQDPGQQQDAEAQDPTQEEGDVAEALQAAAEAAGPDYDVQVEEVAPLKKKVTVTVPRSRIDEKFDEMFGELSQSVQIPGFRIGRAPRRLIEKRYGSEVGDDVRNALIGEALGQAMEKSGIKPLGEPEVDLDAIELPDEGDMSFSFEVEVMPEFDLPELEGIPVERPKVEITDERIDETIDQMREGEAEYEPTEEAAEAGDAVTVSAKISGEDIEPVEREHLELRVAPGQIEGIPLVELEDKLPGAKPGDTVELSAKVAESHPNEEWRGKDVTIEITVSQVSRRVLPSVEEVADGMGYDSVDEWRDHLKRYMEARSDVEAQRQMRERIREYLVENTDVELPAGVLATYANRALRKRYVDLMNMGIPRERIDENIARLKANVDEEAKRDLKLLLIMNRIAEEKGIEVGEEEINAGVAELARSYGRRPERMRQELEREGALSAVADSIRDNKVLDALLESADVTEVEPETEGDQGETEEEPDEKKQAKKTKKTKKTGKAGKTKKKSSKKSAKSSGDKDDDGEADEQGDE